MSERPMRRMNVTIPEELVAGLEDVASLQGSTVSDVVREVVTEFLFGGHWRGIGDVATQAIVNGATNEEALDAVFKEHPGAATTLRSISWYRSKLKKERPNDILSDAEIRRKRERVGG